MEIPLLYDWAGAFRRTDSVTGAKRSEVKGTIVCRARREKRAAAQRFPIAKRALTGYTCMDCVCAEHNMESQRLLALFSMGSSADAVCLTGKGGAFPLLPEKYEPSPAALWKKCGDETSDVLQIDDKRKENAS